jgi:uncharacterized protein (DUF58 family)
MLLSETELKMLSTLRLQLRTKVSRQQFSDLRSTDKGAGIEFADYRQYSPGDDIRRLDWHQYQKHGKLVVRQYEQYEAAAFNLLMDLSDSIVCGGEQKVTSVKKICAAYGFVILKHGYKLSLWPVGGNKPVRRFSSPSQWHNLLEHIEQETAGGKMEITGALERFAQRAGYTENVIAVSDFICHQGFGHLERAVARFRENCVYVHLYSKPEIDPPFRGDIILVDAEQYTEQTTNINQQNIELYKRNYEQYYGSLKNLAVSSGCFYSDVADDLEFAEQLRLLAPDGILCI